jgi:hypothetical protein
LFVRAHTDTKTDTKTDTDTDEGTEGDTVDVSNVQHTISDNIPKSGCPHGSKSRDLSRDVEIDIHRGRAGDTVCTAKEGERGGGDRGGRERVSERESDLY